MQILIADDDDYTREGLIESVEWSQYGILSVLEARDGAEALRLAAKYKPEIVLTDIRMPKLNGIAFAEKLGEICPDSKLLFMSGYLDVEYLKSAIKLSAVDYIEKPIKISEIKTAIAKTVQSVEKSHKLENDLSTKRSLQYQKLTRLLIEGDHEIEEILKFCQEAGYPVNSGYMCLLIVCPTLPESENAFLEEINAFWRGQSAFSIGENLGKGRFIFVLELGKTKPERIETAAKLLLKSFDEIYLATGSKVNDLSGISDSYQTAQRAMEYSFYHPDVRLYRYQDCQEVTAGISPELFVEFYRLLKTEPGSLAGWVKSICGNFTEGSHPSKEQVSALFSSICGAMLQEISSVIARIDRICTVHDVEAIISECRTIAELQEFVIHICSAYCAEVESTSQYSRLVSGVINYISANFSKVDLDLPEIAHHMHLSSPHLNMLFKQETGTTINQYIRDYRIELAKKLISNEYNKMNVISELCGFSSASYFAKVFRTCTTLTPVEYRRMKL
ncbi:response regulator transcription factor [Paenibacillus sp. FSL R7-0128]|uniref:response regulator transcription factor n=1 Tax=Paenibacillus sp. FSL R7-0128 TaxID=2954529 RepID=UPI0030F56171